MMSEYRAYLATLGLSSPMALEGFLEAAPDAIVVVDRSGDIVIVNFAQTRISGWPKGTDGVGFPANLDFRSRALWV